MAIWKIAALVKIIDLSELNSEELLKLASEIEDLAAAKEEEEVRSFEEDPMAEVVRDNALACI